MGKTNEEIREYELPLEIRLDSLTALVQIALQAKFAEEGSELKSFKLSADQGNLFADFHLSGKISGEINISFKPVYAPDADKILLEHLEFNSTGSNLLSKATLWVAKNFFKAKIENQLEETVNAQYQALKSQMLSTSQEIELGKGLKLVSAMKDLSLNNLRVENDSIKAMIKVLGKFKVKG